MNRKGLEKGMVVAGNPYFNCGTWYSCRTGGETAGRSGLDQIITNTYAFTNVAQAFADFDKNAAEMLKVILEF
ncbi:MAG: hypothetical protein LBT13_00720 [Treponema sp.]|nr:hypothetical protein [Treponema sp.]